MRTTFAAALVSALFGLGCWVALEDPAARACDATHPCRSGERCVAARCSAAPVDGWSQGLHGFDLATTTPGGAVLVDFARENRLLAFFVPQAAVPRAYEAATQHLPREASGRVGGKLTLPLGASFRGRLAFLQLVTDSGAVLLEVRLIHEPPLRSLHLSVDPNVLQPDPVINGLSDDTFPPVAQLFAPNVENDVAVSWEVGKEILVFVNGSEIFQRSLQAGSAVPPAAAFPRELRLGHVGYEGSTDAGVSAAFYDWTFTKL